MLKTVQSTFFSPCFVDTLLHNPTPNPDPEPLPPHCQAEGAMDAANLLKPMLARGELRCIGATTLVEYRQHIEKDAAFERRFQQVR